MSILPYVVAESLASSTVFVTIDLAPTIEVVAIALVPLFVAVPTVVVVVVKCVVFVPVPEPSALTDNDRKSPTTFGHDKED